MGSRKRPRQAGGFNKAYDRTGRQVHSEFAAGGESRENLPCIVMAVIDGVGVVVVDVVFAIFCCFAATSLAGNTVEKKSC